MEKWPTVYNALIIKRNGAQGRIRTTDTRIFSPLLYQLSYLGTGRERAGITGPAFSENRL